MNKTKRLLALVLCAVMAMSMLSSFAFAADAAVAGAATSDITGASASGVDPMADNVFIVDNAIGAKDTVYTLTWKGKEYKDLEVKEKAFRTYALAENAFKNAGIEDAIVLVKGVAAAITVKQPVTIYSEAYDIAPYVKGTARNGSDWTENTAFTDVAITLPKAITVNSAAYGKVDIRGFIFTDKISDTARKTTNLDITITNCIIDGSASNPFINTANNINKADNSDSLTLKNIYVKSTSNTASVLLTSYLPAYVTIDGLYAAGGTIDNGTSEFIQVQNTTNITITNSNLQGVDMSKLHFVGGKAAATAGQSKSVVFENNIVNGIGNATAVIGLMTTNYTSLRFNNNTVINNNVAVSAAVAECIGKQASPDNSTTMELEIKGNWLNGISNNIKLTTTSESTELRNLLINIEKNFVNPSYLADESAMVGVSLDATEHGVSANSYYTDAAMKNIVDMSLLITKTTAANGDVFFNNASRNIYYVMQSGDASELNVTFAKPGASYKFYSDKNCTTEVKATDIKFNDSKTLYYFRSTTADGTLTSDVYKVTIVRDTPQYDYFADAFVDENGVLTSDALVADVNCGYVADGRLYNTEWNGQMYTFIKGVNVFESVDAAVAFAKANGMDNAQYLLKDLNGAKKSATKWNLFYPGRFYTEAYNISPVVKGTAPDGSDWAFNEEFTEDKTITIAEIVIPSNGVAGTYEFYGFTITGRYADWTMRHFETKVLICNSHFDLNSLSNGYNIFQFNESKSMTAAEKAFEDSLTVKDSYIDTNGGVGRYISGTIPAHFVWDGVYYNGTPDGFSGQIYCQQFNDTAEYTVRNSLLKNFNTSSRHVYLEGLLRTQVKAEHDRKLVFDNNIFNNSNFSSGGIISGYFGDYTEFRFTNNKVYNTTAYSLVNALDGNAGSAKPMKVTITNNILNSVQSEVKINGRKIDTANSIIENNYATTEYKQGDVTYGGVALTSSNTDLPVGNHWYDSAMTLRSNEILSYSIGAKNAIVDKSKKIVTYIVGENDKCFTTNHIYSTEDPSVVTTYRYILNMNAIVSNPYGNSVTLKYGEQSSPIDSNLIIRSDEPITFPVEASIIIKSPDATSGAVTYALTITDKGPVINTVTVGDKEAVYADGKFSVTLPARGADEAISAVAITEDTVINYSDTVVSNAPGETKEYTITAVLDGVENEIVLEVTRALADYEDLEAAIAKAEEADPATWLPKFKTQLNAYLKAAQELDKATATQADVDAITADIKNILENYIERTELDELIYEYKHIRNKNGQYCDVLYEALQTTVLAVEDKIPSIGTQAELDAAIAELEAAKEALTAHKFTKYVHDNGTENCKVNGTMTATCDVEGCNVTDTKEETGNYKNDVHDYSAGYIYNGDATHLADGTKTAVCSRCNKADTIVAEGTKLTIVNSATMFKDVKADGWYKSYIDYVATYGILNGTGNNMFGVDTTMTRAQFVQVFANLCGIDTSDKNVTSKFTDVEAGKWYAPAVKWAAEQGIVAGTSATTFDPEGVVDRQTMCMMLVNFAKFMKVELVSDVDKTVFPDDAKIAAWAKNAVYACQQAGIVKGNENGYFQPLKSASRAEVSVIIAVFHQDYMLVK